MKVLIERVHEPIADLINGEYGPVIADRQAALINHCQTLGEVWAGFIDGDFVCCWGIVPQSFLSNEAYLWMWSQAKVPHQLLFLRHSRLQVKKFLSRYDTIIGHCKPSAYLSQRYMQWLGAEFGPEADGLRPFTIRSA